MSAFDENWQAVFERYDLLARIERDGFCDITAEEIKAIKEPRLMVKQDHRRDRPEVFCNHSLNILPLSRGNYRIARMELYHDFKVDWAKASDDITVVQPSDVESIDFTNITSEAIAIKSIFCTRILQDFVGDDSLRDTVSGRMGSGVFDFNVKALKGNAESQISVANAQIEIDAGYEGQRELFLLEAKCNLADDFLVRQLYYPYRCWSQKISKTIRPIFFVYSNGIYHLMEYVFEDAHCYNSIRRVNYRKYRISEGETITEDALVDISRCVHPVPELSSVPFPQADSMERVINLCTEMARRMEPMTKEDIWKFFSFTDRQADYYANAGIYLGLVEKVSKGTYQLSAEGQRLFGAEMSYVRKHKRIVELLLAHGVFNDCFNRRLLAGQDLDKDCYESILRNHRECQLSESLYGRRAATVKHWIHWIFNLIEK